MKGQAAVELVVILAVSLLVLFVIISISSQYLADLGSSKIIGEARNSVEDLAAAAKQVYYQGEGAKQQVFVTVPEGVNPSRTGIGNRTIDINVLGTDVIATTDFDVRGKIPTTPGGYTLWVTAKKGYVLIGTVSLSVNPSFLSIHFFSKNESQFSQSSLTFTNEGDLGSDVELHLDFPAGDVNVSLSNPADAGFSLLPSASKGVLLNFTVAENAFGTYSGRLRANASNGDELYVDIIVDVTSRICTNVSCPAAGGANCTPKYAVIETFNDSTYTNFKEIFETSENVIISGSGWQTSSNVTLDIKRPDGPSLPGYPILVGTDSQGSFSLQLNTAGAMTGTYTIFTNDSSIQRSTQFNITKCT